MITSVLIENLRQVVGHDYVVDDEAARALYGTDASGRFVLPGIVVLPGDEAEISQVVRLLAKESVPVTVRGAATGLLGGAVPVKEGAVIGTARLNTPIELVPEEEMIVAPAGVRLVEVKRSAKRAGFWFGDPLDDYGRGTVGGALARNGDGLGGYCGTLHQTLRGIRVVGSDGERISVAPDGPHGQNMSCSGLFLGSEGGLGIITQGTFALLRRMACDRIILASFAHPIAAADAGAGLIAAGLSPLLADVFDTATWTRTAAWPVNETSEGMLLVWLSGMEMDVEDDITWALNVCRDYLSTHSEVLTPENAGELVAGWSDAVRHCLPVSGHVPLDLSAPVAAVPELLHTCHDEARKAALPLHGVTRMASGTLALHIPVLPADGSLYARAMNLAERLHERTLDMQGSPLALHGIGTARVETLRTVHSEGSRAAMRETKRLVDARSLFHTPVAPERPGERRNVRKRSLLEPQITEVREALVEEIATLSSDEECLQVTANSAYVAGQIIRVARTHRASISVHEVPHDRRLDISFDEMHRISLLDTNSRLIAVEGGATLAEIGDALAPSGLWWPVSPFISPTVRLTDLLAWEQAGAYRLGWDRVRDRVVGLEAVTGRGDMMSWGGLTAMNHAGLRLSELCIGARNRYALITAAALHVSPAPTTRTCIAAEFADLRHASVAMDRWFGRGAPNEAPKCRPRAACVLYRSAGEGSGSDDSTESGAGRITALVEFAGLPASVERQVRWAKYIADQNGSHDIFEGANEQATALWRPAANVYAPRPGQREPHLHLVVWTTPGRWLELARALRQVIFVHGYRFSILADIGSGRIDITVEKGTVEPAPLLRLLREPVVRAGAMLEIWSSTLVGQTIGQPSGPLDTIAAKLKSHFDPDNILPDGWGTPFKHRNVAAAPRPSVRTPARA